MAHDKPVALVTGANQGIGLQIARELASNGFTALVGSRSLERGEAAAAEIETDARVIQLDVTDHASIAAAAERIRSEFGRLDVLVDNAAISNTSWEPATPHRPMFTPVYAASKTGLNAMTLAMAIELEETGIKVNAVSLGFTRTKLNKYAGTETVEQGAREAVRLALIGPDGPTGTFSHGSGPLPW